MEGSERVAVLEAEAHHMQAEIKQLQTVIKELTQFIREHMEREEEDRETLIREIQEIRTAQAKMKSFWGGIVFTVSSLWALGAAVVYFIGKGAA